MKSIASKAAIHTSIYSQDDSTDTDTASECKDGSLPEPITVFYDESASDLPPDDLSTKCENTFSSLGKMYPPSSLQLLEQATRDQSKNPVWFNHRAGRITGSLLSTCCKSSGDSQTFDQFSHEI